MASVRTDGVTNVKHARLLLWFHGGRTIFWVVMIPISFVVGWASLVPYVTFLSLWALVETAAGNWQAARAEVAAATVVEDQKNEP